MTGITFCQQDSLEKLPIPELESTLQKYLSVLKPLQVSLIFFYYFVSPLFYYSQLKLY